MDGNIQTARAAGDRRRLGGLVKQPWLRWGAVALWMGVIYYFSDQSSFALLDRVWQPSLVSVSAHFLEYALLAALLWYALRSVPALAGRATLLAFVLAVLYAISDEFHQSFVPGRYPDVRDVLVDAAGALVAVFLLHRRAARRNPADCVTEKSAHVVTQSAGLRCRDDASGQR